jgi:hypothetical protein
LSSSRSEGDGTSCSDRDDKEASSRSSRSNRDRQEHSSRHGRSSNGDHREGSSSSRQLYEAAPRCKLALSPKGDIAVDSFQIHRLCEMQRMNHEVDF